MSAIQKTDISHSAVSPTGAAGSPLYRLQELYDSCQRARQKASDRSLLATQLSQIEPEHRNKLYGYVYALSGIRKTSDPRWGRNHALDDSQRLGRAIHQLALNIFHHLDPKAQNKIYEYVYLLSGSPRTPDTRWGRHHFADDTVVLIAALDCLEKGPTLIEAQSGSEFTGKKRIKPSEIGLGEDLKSDPTKVGRVKTENPLLGQLPNTGCVRYILAGGSLSRLLSVGEKLFLQPSEDVRLPMRVLYNMGIAKEAKKEACYRAYTKPNVLWKRIFGKAAFISKIAESINTKLMNRDLAKIESQWTRFKESLLERAM